MFIIKQNIFFLMIRPYLLWHIFVLYEYRMSKQHIEYIIIVIDLLLLFWTKFDSQQILFQLFIFFNHNKITTKNVS